MSQLFWGVLYYITDIWDTCEFYTVANKNSDYGSKEWGQ